MEKIIQSELDTAIKLVGSGGATLLDVREDDEYAQLHAKGSILYSIKKMEKGSLPNIPKDKPVYTYCGSGGRAGRAALILQNHGWKEVYNLGGLRDWIRLGGATEEGGNNVQ